jgi:hypothetical protein
MSGTGQDDMHRTIERVARESYGRLVAYLSSHTRDVASAEDAGAAPCPCQVTFLFEREQHPIKCAAVWQTAIPLSACNSKRSANTGRNLNGLSRSKLTRHYFGMKLVLSRSRVSCYPKKLGSPSH